MNRERRKTFFIIGAISIVVVSVISVLLVTKSVVGFDIAGVSERDCVPYNVFILKGENDFSVDITWSTKAECVAFVLYGRDRSNLDMVAVDLVNKNKSRDHIVTLDQLLTTEVYYFLINSQEQAYGNNGVPLEFILENL
jgi:hypothetical protein